MYCTNCGNKMDNNDKFCTGCGNKIDRVGNNNNVVNNSSNNRNGTRIASIALGSISIVGSLMVIFGPISLVLSIIGLILGICASKKGKNVAGILLSSIGLVLSLIVSVILLFIIVNAIETVNDKSVPNYNENWGLNDYGEKF